jgi:hypothetical protein
MKSNIQGPWTTLWFFPWLQYRNEYVQSHDGTEYHWRKWRWYEDEPLPEISAPTLPPQLLFDWHRDYAPLWEPGSKAFWLEPEPGDLPAGKWPLPFVEKRPQEPNIITWHFGFAPLLPKRYVGITRL